MILSEFHIFHQALVSSTFFLQSFAPISNIFLISFVTDKRIGTKSIENTLVVFFLICRPSAQKKSDQYSFQLLGDCQRGVLISKKVLFSNLISHEIININIYEFYIMEMVVFYMSYCITLNLRGLSEKKR